MTDKFRFRRYFALMLLLVVGWAAASAQLAFEAGKFYTIKNVQSSKFLTIDQGSYTEGNAVNATPLATTAGYFNIEPGSGNTCAMKSGEWYMSFSTNGNMSGWNTGRSATTTALWTIEPVSGATSQYYIRSSKGYLKYDGTNNYAYTNGAVGEGNKVKWTITEVPAHHATVVCLDADGNELQSITLTFMEDSKSVSAPVIAGYDLKSGTSTTQTARNGSTVTFRYTLHSYTIYYDFYDISDINTRHERETYSLTVKQDLPAPSHSCSGKQMVGVPIGKVTGDATYRIYCYSEEGETEAQTISLAYAYYIDGVKCHTGESRTATVGEGFPALDILPAGVTGTRPTRAVEKGDAGEVRIDVTTNIAFKYAPAFDSQNAVWYKLNIGPDHRYFNYTADATNMVLTSTVSDADQYLFTFVGNPFTGYSLYNRQAGASMVLSAPAPNPNSNEGKNACPVMTATPVPSDYNMAWDIEAKGSGFLFSRHDEGFYLNRRQDIVNGSQVLSFWTADAAKNDGGSLVYMTEYAPGVTTVTTNPACATPAADKVYRLYNKRVAGHMITENADHELQTTDGKRQGDYSQMWVLETSSTSGAYTLRNASTGRFVKLNNKNNVATTADTATPLYLTAKSGYYGIGLTANASGDQHLNTNPNTANVVSWSLGDDQGSGWVFEEVLSAEATLSAIQAYVKSHNQYATLASGRYYRLKNYSYPTRYLAENYANGMTISGNTTAQTANQNALVWKVEGSDAQGYTFKNVFTGHYIADQANQSAQYPTTATASSAKRFYAHADGGDAWSLPHYAFSRGNSSVPAELYSLHCAQSQENKIVAWTYTSAPASWWNLEEVLFTDAELADIASQYAEYTNQKSEIDGINAGADALNAKLQQYFEDYACTQLRSGYQRLSDTQLRAIAAADNLPESITAMMIRVKNDKWELDSERNRLTKLFRINDYELYTDRSVWGNITGVGPFAMFCNPTGVTVKNGDIVYIYVDEQPADTDIKVGMYLAADTEYRTETRIDLHAGINTWICPNEGELIVDYRLANADKKYTDYPRLRFHIEGGEATGCWDATRKMTNADWSWLCRNAFEAPFLHVKGESTMLNLVTEHILGNSKNADVERIMKAWDWHFLGLQRKIGNDGQWDERYRPFVNPRHSYGGNPNWGGQSGSNHPTLGKGGEDDAYLFSYDNFYEDNVWELLHEIGHGCSGPINLAGMTEISNNSLSQMVSFEWGRCYSRGEAGSGLATLFNYTNNTSDKRGWTWLDYMRYAKPYYDYSLHVANQMLFHLYLYFDALGHRPSRDFIPRLFDEMRRNPIRKGNSVNTPTRYYEEYWRFAEACAKVSQTDLWEFFEVYGFWKYVDEVMSTRPHEEGKASDPVEGSAEWNAGIRYLGDYGGYYLQMPVRGNAADEARMKAMREFMHSQPNKAENIFFIEDRLKTQYVAEDAPVAKLGLPGIAGKEKKMYWSIEKQGDFGNYDEFGTVTADGVGGIPAASNLNYSLSSRATTKQFKDTNEQAYILSGYDVTISGSGLCGIKIYKTMTDDEGKTYQKLIFIENNSTFFLPADIATELKSGDCTLVIALPDGSSLPLYNDGKVLDMNLDGRISIADLSLLVKALNTTTWKAYDLNDVGTLRTNVLSAPVSAQQ